MAKIEKEMNQGWCIGSRVFKESIANDYLRDKGLMRMENAELKEFNTIQWEQFVVKALRHLKIEQEAVQRTPRSAAWKLAIATKLKREGSVTNHWLSNRLHMGVPNAVSNNCGRYHRERESQCKFAKKLVNMKYEH